MKKYMVACRDCGINQTSRLVVGIYDSIDEAADALTQFIGTPEPEWNCVVSNRFMEDVQLEGRHSLDNPLVIHEVAFDG